VGITLLNALLRVGSSELVSKLNKKFGEPKAEAIMLPEYEKTEP
jgi:hypothetical protein